MVAGGNIVGDGRKSSSTALNAFFGLLAFGLPGLWYAVFGRLSFHADSENSDGSYHDEELENKDNDDPSITQQ